MTSDRIIDANKIVHSSLVLSGNYEKSPHFLPENQTRVKNKLATEVMPLLNSGQINAVDFGCGTGFMINLLVGLVSSVNGVDITSEMLDKVDVSSGKVSLTLGLAEHTPFDDCSFQLATAYSFLDHLTDLKPFLEEVHRVLQPGGVFFAGLNPNAKFASMIESAIKHYPSECEKNPIIAREVQGVRANGTKYNDEFGIDKEVLELAENIKTVDGGFHAEAVQSLALDIGFKSIKSDYEWFLGQAIYREDLEGENVILKYLSQIAPISNQLFKYVSFIMLK